MSGDIPGPTSGGFSSEAIITTVISTTGAIIVALLGVVAACVTVQCYCRKNHPDQGIELGTKKQEINANDNAEVVTYDEAERCDRAYDDMELINHESYHGAIELAEAEERLRMTGMHCYLTRFSESQQCNFLTVITWQKQCAEHRIYNFKIITGFISVELDGRSETFSNVEEMLRSYSNKRIHHSVENIGEPLTINNHKRILKNWQDFSRVAYADYPS